MVLKDPRKDDKRSKSADSRWAQLNNRIANKVSSLPVINRNKANAKPPETEVKTVIIEDETKKKRRRKKKTEDEEQPTPPLQPPPPKIVIHKDDKRKKTLWRHIIWLLILFAYSLLGGMIFSAIEGEYDRAHLIHEYDRNMDVYRRKRVYQQQLYQRFRDIDRDNSSVFKRKGASIETYKESMFKDAMSWYEKKLGFFIEEPIMHYTKWNLWGGVYYSASLYTTIGYGNFHPKTTTGRILSMLYAIIGIPLVFTILLEWGFLYFTWIEYGWNWMNEKFCQKSLQRKAVKKNNRERFRRVGSEMSLNSLSPLLSPHSVHRTISRNSNIVNTIDHQIESNNPLRELDMELPIGEQAETVPMKAALLFFLFWISLSAFVVRLWEKEWTYFTAFYFFFTSLTTIGLGDVVTKTPNFIIFNLALTLVGLSVVGLCLAIVQAKVRLVFDRLIRSIDSQYRIRQIDPDVATMTIINDENEGIKRLIESQPLQDRIIYLFMDEHKKSMLRDRWKEKSGMTNRLTQTYPSLADKYVQTGQRVYDQPGTEDDSEYESDEESTDSEAEYDEAGNKIIPPSTRRYIYTVFD